jgi:hypothetical protein
MEAQKKAAGKVCFKRVESHNYTETYMNVKKEIDSTWPEWKKTALQDNTTSYNNQDFEKVIN